MPNYFNKSILTSLLTYSDEQSFIEDLRTQLITGANNYNFSPLYKNNFSLLYIFTSIYYRKKDCSLYMDSTLSFTAIRRYTGLADSWFIQLRAYIASMMQYKRSMYNAIAGSFTPDIARYESELINYNTYRDLALNMFENPVYI